MIWTLRRFDTRFWRLPLVALLALLGGVLVPVANCRLVEFAFKLEPAGENPFVREIWAEVTLPSGGVVNLPAFYAGENRHAVRVRPETEGVYQLGKITEVRGERCDTLEAKVIGSPKKNVRTPMKRPAVVIDPADPRAFAFASGGKFVPFGANLAWPDARGVEFYKEAFASFSRSGLNWTRVWMAHWGGLNLDWLPARMGESLRGGELDLRVAEAWDQIVELAEENGIYMQVVLQHHGQYSSRVNPNWADNPWNAANGGFLKSPEEFFTSPEALWLTLHKYRYIVARWGYSPAVMAWELFNEVHWTDAMRGEHADEAAVARWHSQVADYLRSIDRHGHLVTTSTEDLRSAIYADLDYCQPHLYMPNLVGGARRFEVSPARLPKPVFYGEAGDDHLRLTDEQKKSGAAIVPPVWASLVGHGGIPAQPWLGSDLLTKKRLPELAAVARFLVATGLTARKDLLPFSPAVETKERVPFTLAPGYRWHRRPAPEIAVPADGRDLIEHADLLAVFVSAQESKKNGYPHHATLLFNFPQDTTLRIPILDTGVDAGGMRISVNGIGVAQVVWPERPKEAPQRGPFPQPDVLVSLPAGPHALVIENPVSSGWFEIKGIDVEGMAMPALAAGGKRTEDFAVAWVWHRESVYLDNPAGSVTGVVLIEDLPAGLWQVTWWNTLTGKAGAPVKVDHAGGVLRVPTPAISRHAAVVIERSGK